MSRLDSLIVTGTERARRLETAVHEILSRADGISEQLVYRDPAPDDWSAMKVLAHVAEFLTYWARQATEVAARTGLVAPFGRTHDDPARIAAVNDHARDRLADVRRRVEGSLAEALTALAEIPESGWARTGRHARRGEMSVEQIVDQFMLDHADEHLAQLERSLAAARQQA